MGKDLRANLPAAVADRKVAHKAPMVAVQVDHRMEIRKVVPNPHHLPQVSNVGHVQPAKPRRHGAALFVLGNDSQDIAQMRLTGRME